MNHRHPLASHLPMSPAPAVALLLVLGACDFGEVTTYDLRGPAAATATFTVRTDDLEAAQALGWPDARIPAAEVTISSADPEKPWRWEGIADGEGSLTVPDLPAGSHRITVRRSLSSEERALAAAAGALAFILDEEMRLDLRTTTIELQVPASRRRSLVISEFYGHEVRAANGNCCYYFGSYLEVYNNADTTIYLDGKIVGKGFEGHANSPTRPCANEDHLRVDPEGIWSRFFEMFPGSGRDYPLQPGQTAVVATDAIDHRPYVFGGRGVDLSQADFEFVGPGDVDNPAVPNMINIGLREWILGRGLYFSGWSKPFLAENVHVPDLLLDRDVFANEYVRIPAERILDVFVASRENPEVYQLCPALSHPSINRGWVPVLGRDDGHLSLQRRPLLTLPEGRVVLQHTRTSRADFMVAPAAPGSVPRP